MYRYGEKVVDLWGGVRDPASGEPWRADTMVIVHSATKGLAAMTLALAHSRGWLDYDERVCTYWPEFAQAGKEHITVRQLLAHQAGLFGFDEKVDRDVVADPDRLAAIMARQRPAWEPGERQAYHAISLGFYESELLRRIDPRHRRLGQFFHEELAEPLGVDFYIGTPASIPGERLAPLLPPSVWAAAPGIAVAAIPACAVPTVGAPPIAHSESRHRVLRRSRWVHRARPRGSVGRGHRSAHGIAKAYGVFANGGTELGLRTETLDALRAPAQPSRHGYFDECLRVQAKFSLGFMKPSESFPFGHTEAFGAPGAGGAMGHADPEAGIGYGYVTNRMGTELSGDARDIALRAAIP